jgi:hypothetical protein
MLARSSKFTVFCLVIIGYHLLNLQAFTITGQCSQSCSYLHDNTIADCRARGCTGLPEDLPPTVTDLDLSLNNFDVGLVLPNIIKNMSLRLTNLTRLNLAGSLTGYSHLNGSMFAVLPKLKYLNFSYADILSIGQMSNVLSVTHLDVGRMTKTKWNMMNDSFPANVEYLDLSGNTIVYIGTALSDLKRLTWLVLRETDVVAFCEYTLPPTLIHLDLSYSRKHSHGNTSAFKRLLQLKTLRLSYADIRVDSRRTMNLFDGLSNLIELHLDGNCISWIPDELFRNLSQLQVLNLSGNALTGWENNVFTNIIRPLVIDLSRNSLEIIYKLPYWTPGPLTMDFTENYLSCICDSDMDDFAEWLVYADRHYDNNTSSTSRCFMPRNLMGQSVRYAMIVIEKCDQIRWFLMLLPAVCVLVATVLVSVLSYTYRWYIRWYFYRCCYCSGSLANRTQPGYGAINGGRGPRREYDIYLSCASHDIDFAQQFVDNVGQPDQATVSYPDNNYTEQNESRGLVNDSSYADLESDVQSLNDSSNDDRRAATATPARRYSVYSKLCNKNFEAGWELEQMERAVYSSRNVVVVLSSNYVHSCRHLFELRILQQAMIERHGYSAHKHIILVAIEKTNQWIHLLPAQLRTHFNTAPLRWCENKVRRQEVFWYDLHDQLKRCVGR